MPVRPHFAFALTFSLAALTLATLLFAPAHAQNGNATDGDGRAAAFFTTNPTRDFTAAGAVSSIVLANGTGQQAYILAGNWTLAVSGGNVTAFESNLTMVSTDGADRHTHTITNFKPNAAVPVILDIHGSTFTGVTDMTMDGSVEWRSVQTTVTIAKQDAIVIALNSSQNLNRSDSHFNGQPVYGIVFSIKDRS